MTGREPRGEDRQTRPPITAGILDCSTRQPKHQGREVRQWGGMGSGWPLMKSISSCHGSTSQRRRYMRLTTRLAFIF